jgi:putative FmdB family regulatory protein
MPIYEYECLTCGTTFEKRQSYYEAPIADCPNGHAETRRLLSTPAIVFKGSGFYVNDSRKDGKNGASSNGKSSDSSSHSENKSSEGKSAESKSESKSSESKSETKAEAKA